jgi:hypothetical protein
MALSTIYFRGIGLFSIKGKVLKCDYFHVIGSRLKVYNEELLEEVKKVTEAKKQEARGTEVRS